MFLGRTLCIATMHNKEQVLKPLLEKHLGVHCITAEKLNTDLLGTFSGEVERVQSPLETARRKCQMATELTGCDLAVSSEGSFGPHPVLGFFSANEELLFFFDKTNKLEITAHELSTHTNFAAGQFNDWESLKAFAEKSLFPSHGLIAKNEANTVLEKGIQDWHKLENLFYQTQKNGSALLVETDMRACFNPTRMQVIETCAHKLVAALKSNCPACKQPGFVVSGAVPGLPCNLCGLPTKSTLKHVSVCKTCSYQTETLHPHGKTSEDPGFCDFCNP